MEVKISAKNFKQTAPKEKMPVRLKSYYCTYNEQQIFEHTKGVDLGNDEFDSDCDDGVDRRSCVKLFRNLWTQGKWSELGFNNSLADNEHLQNFLDANPPSLPDNFETDFFMNDTPTKDSQIGGIVSTFWSSSNRLRSLHFHKDKDRINTELRLGILNVSKKYEIEPHNLPKQAAENVITARNIRNDILNVIKYIAKKYNCTGGRWFSVRKKRENIDSFWKKLVFSHLKTEKVNFDAVAVTKVNLIFNCFHKLQKRAFYFFYFN
jgi:hypothetical protein